MDDDRKLTERIIGCAIEVHRVLGPGLLEATYERALCIELGLQNLTWASQVEIPISYKGHSIGLYRVDLIVDDLVVLELKSVDQLNPVFEAQLLAYLRASGKKIGLILNFNRPLLREGIKRLVL